MYIVLRHLLHMHGATRYAFTSPRVNDLTESLKNLKPHSHQSK